MPKRQIPAPSGPYAKIGDKVLITEGEFAGMVGEVVAFVNDGKNIIKTVKIAREDGKITLVEVKDIVLEIAQLAQDIGKSNVFKKFWRWVTNLFRKKVFKYDFKGLIAALGSVAIFLYIAM
jgi:hypothetical protein